VVRRADVCRGRFGVAYQHALSFVGPSDSFLRRFAIRQTTEWKSEGIVHTASSPYAKLHDVPIRAVTIGDGFWGQRRKTNVESSIPTMHDLMIRDGRMENFRRLSGKSAAPQKGRVASDTDIYKWTEGVSFTLQSGDRPALREEVSNMLDDVVAAQDPSGYLNTYFHGDRAPLRMQWVPTGGGRGAQSTQETGHELYTLGHMLQSAIAYYRATGDRKLLDAGIRDVNNFVLKDYGPGIDKRPIISGHPEIEMALVELYRVTGDKRDLDLAGYILHGDPERIQLRPDRYVYLFSGIPFTSRTKLEGHAVRAMYACSGATDYFLETGDQAYWTTLEVLWKDLVDSKLYITGGVGARNAGEAFGDPYELPNGAAYSESCAAIGNMMWNWRMLAATGEARFTDVMERAIYNTINAGMSLDGTQYCYRNPLEYTPDARRPIRNPWYDTLCCPPNLERTLTALPGYFYSTSREGVYVHLYDNATLDWHLENGTGVKIIQKTNYPWDGDVEMTVTPAQATDFTLYLRIPGWSPNAKVTVNGAAFGGTTAGEYIALKGRWAPGDKVRLQLDMTPQVIASNPRLQDNRGRVAVQRGPLVYCIEQLDQAGVTSLSDLALTVGADPGKEFQVQTRKEMLGGIVALQHSGVYFDKPLSQEPLYQPFGKDSAKGGRAVSITLIPYYAWANREPSAMQVWMAVRNR
jgi:uncharacterized protein